MTYGVPIAIAAVIAYGISAALEVELRSGRRVTAVAAFGPVLVSLGPAAYKVASLYVLVPTALLLELISVLALRRRMRVLTRDAIAILMSIAIFQIVAAFGAPTRFLVLGAIALSAASYFVVEALLPVDEAVQRPRLRHQAIEAAPLYAILASTAGLTILAMPVLKWAAFPVLLVPLLATRQEFAQFSEIRRTYNQTVTALAGLAENAGYSRVGHHERVARLCGSLADTLGLSASRKRRLELLALLHDVGAVSLPDPSDVEVTDPEEIALKTALLVEESQGLAGAGQVVVEAARRSPSTLEARILLAANAYDDAAATTDDPLGVLRTTVGVDDPIVFRALTAVAAS